MAHSGFKFVEAEDRRAILAPGVRLTFLRDGDRWTHALEVGKGPARVVGGIAQAVEGDPARDDPSRVVSPAYQDIQPHASGGDIQALLMGQATPHYFSAVVTARREGRGVSIKVDVADRCREPVAALAATYLVRLGSGALIDASADRIIWGGGALGGGRLELSAEGPATVALAEAGRQASRVQALAGILSSTFTQRLVYRWRWTPPGDPPPSEDHPHPPS